MAHLMYLRVRHVQMFKTRIIAQSYGCNNGEQLVNMPFVHDVGSNSKKEEEVDRQLEVFLHGKYLRPCGLFRSAFPFYV